MLNKHKKLPILFALILLASLILAPVCVNAAKSSAQIELCRRVYTLQSDGGISVAQSLTFAFPEKTDNVSFFVRGMTSQADDLALSIDGQPLVSRNAQGYDRKSDVYNYKTSVASDGVNLSCYYPNAKKSVTIELSYTIANALTIYSDAAILKAGLVDDAAYAVTRTETTVVLPARANAEQIDVFWDDYHLSPESKTDGKSVTVTLEDIPEKKQVQALVAMPVSLFADAPNSIRLQSDMLEELSETRDRQLTYLNYQSWFTQRQGRVVVVALAAAVLLGCVTRIRRRRHRPVSAAPGKNVLPDMLSPMQFALLMGFYRRGGKKRRARNALYGTLISLIDRGLLSVYPVEGNANDAMFVYTPWEGCETSGDENILLLLLFEDIAAGQSSVTLSQIKRYTRLLPGVVSSALRHMDDYSISEMAQAHDIEFFRFVKLPLDFIFQMAFLAGSVCMAILQCWSAATAMFCGVFIISLFGRDRLHRLSRSGEDLYARGRAFRHYILLCTTTKQDEKPELSWWSSVLGYAAAIGLAPYLSRTLPTLYPELNDADFAQEREGTAPLWGMCAPSQGAMATCLWRLSCMLVSTQRVIERSDTEK